jgi:hypothetical protein
MLRRGGFEATPAVLCTRSGGGNLTGAPILNDLDYVLAHVVIQGNEFFLDASRSRLGFARLKTDCFNGPVRLVNEFATRKILRTDSLLEVRSSSLLLKSDENGNISGQMQIKCGYYESLQIRDYLSVRTKEDFFDQLKKKYSDEFEFSDPEIEGLEELDEKIILGYHLTLKKNEEPVLYLNPMIGEGLIENPFPSADRQLPVELTFPVFTSHVLKIDLPENRVIEETPKSEIVHFNEMNQGVFEYKINSNTSSVLLQTKITMNRSQYNVSEYEVLRNFFSEIVRKHNELLVIKKKN